MITALIRTHPGREELTERAIKSAEGCEVIVFEGEKVSDYSYNLYCNDLKAEVKDGFFFFLDSDDYVMPGALKRIEPLLKEDMANVCQMLRNGKPKPLTASIVEGKIGLPCLILHSKYKHLAEIGDKENSDFTWIKAVTDVLEWQFIRGVLVNVGKRNYGR